MNKVTKSLENKLIKDALRATSAENKRPEADKTPPKTPPAGQDVRPVVVCFGTMSISGDSVGPMVGTLLTRKYGIEAFVYGTEEHPVNGKNMQDWMDFIAAAHKGAPIIAVDASLGQADRVGQVVLRDDGVCPAAIKGKKARFGDVGILAVVAENSGDALMQLMSVPHVYATEIAGKVANMIYSAL